MKPLSRLLFLVALFFGGWTLSAEKVILATGEWEPLTSENLPGYGCFTELVSAAFQEVGLSPEYRFFPWVRAEAELESGRVFGIFPYTTTAERKAKYDYSDTIMYSTYKFFYYLPAGKIKPNLTWEKLSELKSYVLGGNPGYWYDKVFRDNGLQVDYVYTEEQNLSKLVAGRVDLVPQEEIVGWQLIRRLYPKDVDKFATVAQALQQSELSVMISRAYPKSASLRAQLNLGLKKIRQNGIYQKILAKYGIK